MFMMNHKWKILGCLAAACLLTACRVETKSEPIPEAEGSGKKSLTIRMEPMSRDEIKSATNDAIDKTAEAATQLRSAATTAAGNLQHVSQNIGTMSQTLRDLRRDTPTTTTAP